MNVRISILLTILITCYTTCFASQKIAELDLEFKINNSEIDADFGDNARQINNFLKELQQILDAQGAEDAKPGYVVIRGTTSLEGTHELNSNLGRQRRATLERFIKDRIVVPDSIIVRSEDFLPWDWFKKAVLASDIPNKEEIVAICNEDGNLVPYRNGHIDSRILKLQQMGGGHVWETLMQYIFPHMRRAQAILTFERPDIQKWPEPEPEPEPEPVQIAEPDPVIAEPGEEETVVEEIVEEPVTETVEPVSEEYIQRMYIKTNVPAWAFLWQNIALEVDIAKHWSFSVPVYWSPYDYGKQTIKFRTLAVVPEFRYWPKAENMGFFVNAHFGLAYYNFAANGTYRYQDHDANTPAIGGGVGVGYRFYFCKNHHWSMEAAVGAGIYKLDYDIFLNTDRTSLGALVNHKKRTFYGIDQAAFSISYSFGLKKKGAEQ